jgi:biotin carboxyl carrier protein
LIVHVEAAGRTRAVEVRRNNGGFTVVLDGHEHTVDVSDIGATWSLLLGTQSYEVAFVEGPDGAMMVHVDGQPVPVSVAPLRPAWRARGRGPSTALGAGPAVPGTAGSQRIVAPMPGKIVKVLVKPGDAVAARQGVVIVEAMKMENELRSQTSGTVSDVRVKEGDSVEAGAILVIVE